MSKRMLVNAAQEGEVRVGIVEDNVLEDLNVAIAGNELIRGNIYKAVVVSVESGLQAAFLDYGAERNGFITFNDIHPRYYNKRGAKADKRLKIQDAVKPGAEVLVQVYKEEVGNKGAAFTTDITLPGRYLVLMPFSDSGGVSRKIESESARKKLKELIAKLNPPDDIGVIVRTAGQGRTKTELQKDFQAQLRLWGHAQARFQQLNSPGLVHAEPDVVIRSIRDYVTDDVTEIVVDDEPVRDRLVEYFERQASDIVDRIKAYRGKMPIFSNFGLERQLENITSHKVPLPSGGSIVINPTEALTAVDVNSGKSRGQKNQEEMALNTNLEASIEVARQLRLRDLGGLVVIDFIDMYENKNRRSVEKSLKQAMKRDKARVEVGRISKFGMLELSRQRVKARLISSTHNVCPMCEGSGFVMSTDVAAMAMLRRLQELSVSAPKGAKIKGRLPVPVALKLLNEHRNSLAQLEQEFGVTIEIVPEIGAVSTRDAFEVIKAGAIEKPREERDRRDRRDRDRNRGNRGRKKSSARATISEEVDDAPYEPPKVVGFIDPEQLATADIGATSNEDESEASPEAEEGGGRRRRRRRRGRRGQGARDEQQASTTEDAEEAEEQAESTDNSEPTVDAAGDDELARRRQAARERNRARRTARQNRDESEAAPKEKGEDSPSRQRRSRRANRSAAQRLRENMNTDEPAAAAPEASQEAAEPAPSPKPSRGRSRRRRSEKVDETVQVTSSEPEVAEAPEEQEAPKGRRRRGASSAQRLKQKAEAGNASEGLTETVEPEVTEVETPKSTRRARRSSGGAAAKLKAKLETGDIEESAATAPKRAQAAKKKKKTTSRRTGGGAAARLLARNSAQESVESTEEVAEAPQRSRRTKKATDTTEPKRARASRAKKAESTETTEAKPKRASRAKKAESTETTETKPKRASRAKKAAEATEAEAAPATPRRTRRTKKAAEATEAEAAPAPRTKRTKKAAEVAETEPAPAKPKRARRTKKAAESTEAAPATPTRASRAKKATEAAEAAPAKPKRASRAKKAAEPAEEKPKRARRTKKAAEATEATEAKPKRASRAKTTAAAAEKPKRKPRKKKAADSTPEASV